MRWRLERAPLPFPLRCRSETVTADIVVNVRTLRARPTGVQRYTREVVSRLAPAIDVVAPSRVGRGVAGHVWEQAVLPLRVRGRLLWSPGGTGPWWLSAQVVTIHDAGPLDHPEWFGARFARWYGFLQPRLLENATGIITVSEFSRRRLVARVPEAADRIRVVPLAVGDEFAPAAPSDVEAVRRRLALGARYVLVLGSLQPRKNLARTLEAWGGVRERLPDATLAVAGGRFDELFGGPGLSRVPPGVRLLGYVDEADLPALYTGAEVLLFASLYEGFGLPALEAMASGTPVVAADATSLPEVVGDAALLVDPEDARAIGVAVTSVLEDEALRRRLRTAGLERARGFSWDRTAAATREVLLEAAHRRRRR